jgi:hypothetical protein
MCDCTFTILVIALLTLIVIIFLVKSRKDNFTTFPKVPEYSTTFSWYPGLNGQFGSDREWYCLQQNSSYPAYKNCMLYLE